MRRSARGRSVDPLRAYFAEVRRGRLLTQEEEQALARAFRDRGATAAAHRLVTANLRFVVKMAYRYRGPGVRLSDLVQEGNLGLMRAVRTFDPDRGLRFVCYAAWSIRAAMQAHIQRSRFGPAAGQHVSLDAPACEEEGAPRVAELASDAPPLDAELAAREARALARARVGEALARLGERERYIIEQRAMSDEPASLAALALRLGLSAERTRQLEVRAKERLRRALAELAAELGWPGAARAA